MTPEQLDTIAAEAAGGCSTCVELVAEVRRLTAERNALRAALADAKAGFELELPGQWPQRFDTLLAAHPAPAKPDTVAVPRSRLESICAHGLNDADVAELRALLGGGK